MKAATVAEKRPVFDMCFSWRIYTRWNGAHKYEDAVRVSFPTLDYILILLLCLSEVHGPDRIRRVPILLAWNTDENRTPGRKLRKTSTYPEYPQFAREERSRVESHWYLWPVTEKMRNLEVEDEWDKLSVGLR